MTSLVLSFPRVSEAAWTFLPFGQEVEEIHVFRPSPNPLLWLGTEHGIVLVRGSDTLWLHPSNSDLPLSNPYDQSNGIQWTFTAMDSSGGFWFASARENLIYRIDTLGRVSKRESGFGPLLSFDPARAVALTADKEGVLLGRADGRIERFGASGNTRTSFRVSVSSSLTSLAWIRDTLWIGTDEDTSGSLRYRTDLAEGVFRDPKGRALTAGVKSIWGTEGALAPVKFLSLRRPADIFSVSDSLVVIGAKGEFLDSAFLAEGTGSIDRIRRLGRYPGLYRRGTGVAVLLEMDSGSGEDPSLVARDGFSLEYEVRSAAGDTGNTILVGTSTALRSEIWEGGTRSVRRVAYGPTIPGGSAIGMVNSSDGTLHIATDSVVVMRRPGDSDWRVVHKAVGAPILCISQDSQKQLHIGQGNGLFRSQNGKIIYVPAFADSVVAIAHSRTHTWIYQRGGDGRSSLWRQELGQSVPTRVPFTDFGPDSSGIESMTARDDGTLWVQVLGSIRVWTTVSWRRWRGMDSETDTTFHLWSAAFSGEQIWAAGKERGARQYAMGRWGLTGLADRSRLAQDTILLKERPLLVAESDTSAVLLDWERFFRDQYLYRLTVARGTEFLRDVGLSLHRRKAIDLRSDGNGGFWILYPDGLEYRNLGAGQTVGTSRGAETIATAVTLRGASLQLRVKAQSQVRISLFGFDGRLIESKNVGLLGPGTHTVPMERQRYPHVIRIHLGSEVVTLKSPGTAIAR